MEKKYINNGNLDVYSSLILSFASNIIGACFAWLINKLINYSYVFDLIHNEVKNKKKYFIIIQRVWKIIKRRLIIYIFINIIINFICVYYLTLFCIIYKNSQVSLFINYITGFITSILYALILSIIISFLRKFSINLKLNKLYYFSKYLDINF